MTSRFVASRCTIRQNRTKPVSSLNTVIPWRTVTMHCSQPRVTCFCIDPLMHKYLKTRARGSPLTNPLEQAAFLQLVVLHNMPAAGRHYLCAPWLTAWPQRWPGFACGPSTVSGGPVTLQDFIGC